MFQNTLAFGNGTMTTAVSSTITTQRFVSENARQLLEKQLHEIITSTICLRIKLPVSNNVINCTDIAISTSNAYVPTYTFSLFSFDETRY